MARISRGLWLRWGIAVGGVLVVVLVYLLLGPDQHEVEQRLEDKYGVSVEWGNNARFEPEVLVVDGQDISDDCTVTGEWASLDDVAIACENDVGIDEIDSPDGRR